MAEICENQMQINDTLHWNSNTMSSSKSGLSTRYKTLATKKLGRNQTLPLPNMKLEKAHKSGRNLANWRYSLTKWLPGGELAKHLQSTSPKAHNLIAANPWRSSEGAEWGQESKALKKTKQKLQSSRTDNWEEAWKQLRRWRTSETRGHVHGARRDRRIHISSTLFIYKFFAKPPDIWLFRRIFFVFPSTLTETLLRSDWELANGEGWMCFNCTWFHPNRIQYLSSILTNVFSSHLFREYWFNEQGEPNRYTK
jgi:hypothetical protein